MASHLLKWPKSETVKNQMLAWSGTWRGTKRVWSNRNSRTLLAGVQNDAAILEDSFAVSYKTKHTLTT